ncbi:MAG: alkaline phosphatase family protein [Bacteroidota bacterium]
MRHWHWPLLLLLTLILSVFSLLPHTSGLADFRSDFGTRPVPTVAGWGRPIAGAVYLIVVDGLRHDTAHSEAMPFLAELRRNGAAWGMLRAGLPSYSRPAYARIITGAPAELTGLTMNDQDGRSPVPTVFSLAAKAGLRTASSAHAWIRELVDGPVSGARTGRFTGGGIQAGYSYLSDDEPDSRVFAAAREFVVTFDPDLLLVLPVSVDTAGHRYGGASVEYRRSAAAADAALADFFHSLPDQNYVAIITGDHGHRNAGGHGGEEEPVVEVPCLIFGQGVRPGPIRASLDQLDIAPTIAAWLGLPMAGSMGGRVMQEVFLDQDAARSAQNALVDARAAYLAGNRDLLGKRAGTDGASFAAAWAAARRSDLVRRFLIRLPVALMLVGLVAIFLVGVFRQSGWRWPMLAGLAYPLYFYAALRLLGADYSYSAMVSAADFTVRVVLAGLIALAILTWAGAALRRNGEAFFAPTSLGVWTAQSLITILAWLIVGGNLRRYLPDLGWQVFLMVQSVVTMIASVYALLGQLAMLVYRSLRRRGPGQSPEAERRQV